MKSHYRVVVIGGGVVGASVLYHLAKLGWSRHRPDRAQGADRGLDLARGRGLPRHQRRPQHRGPAGLYDQPLQAARGGERAEHRPAHDRRRQHGGHAPSAGNGSSRRPRSSRPWGSTMRGWSLPTRSRSCARSATCRGSMAGSTMRMRAISTPMAPPKPMSRRRGSAAPTWSCATACWSCTPAPTAPGMWSPSRAPIRAEHVVNAGGLWAKQVGLMAGVDLPVTPMEHHYLVTESIPEIAAMDREITLTVDLEGFTYLRQEGKGVLLGVYELNPRHWQVEGAPWDYGMELIPEDIDRIAPELAKGYERFPCLNEVGIKRWINGAFTFTPDGNPLVGPVPGLRNYWTACGVMAGFSQGGGVGLSLAQWMIEGEPGSDIYGMDVARYGRFASNRRYLKDLTAQFYRRRFVLTYPNEQLPAGRPLRTPGAYDLMTVQGCQWGALWGLEVPLYFAPKGEAFHETPTLRRSNAFPLVAEECRRTREGVGLLDSSAFSRYEITGRGCARLARPPARLPHPAGRQGAPRADAGPIGQAARRSHRVQLGRPHLLADGLLLSAPVAHALVRRPALARRGRRARHLRRVCRLGAVRPTFARAPGLAHGCRPLQRGIPLHELPRNGRRPRRGPRRPALGRGRARLRAQRARGRASGTVRDAARGRAPLRPRPDRLQRHQLAAAGKELRHLVARVHPRLHPRHVRPRPLHRLRQGRVHRPRGGLAGARRRHRQAEAGHARGRSRSTPTRPASSRSGRANAASASSLPAPTAIPSARASPWPMSTATSPPSAPSLPSTSSATCAPAG